LSWQLSGLFLKHKAKTSIAMVHVAFVSYIAGCYGHFSLLYPRLMPLFLAPIVFFFSAAFEGAVVVFHMAAPDSSINNFHLHYSVNVEGL
jgi:hypothetical protein